MTTRAFSAGLVLVLAGAAFEAHAGVTFDFAFRSTDIHGAVIAGGSPVNGGRSFLFEDTAAARANPGIVLDVLLRTGDLVVGTGFPLAYDDANGLAVASATEWFGQGVAFNMMGAPVGRFESWRNLECVDELPGIGDAGCAYFGGFVRFRVGDPPLPTGTYRVGTVIWDTSNLSGSSGLWTFDNQYSVADGFIDGQNRPINDLHARTGFINIVPEPGTAALLALGMLGLALVQVSRPG